MAEDFEDIRSFRDFEANGVCKALFAEPRIAQMLTQLIPGRSMEDLKKTVDNIHSLWDFQHYLMLPILQNVILPTFNSLSVSGLENLNNKNAYLFISNHRDIVLDSAVLNYFLHINDFSTAEIAIGDNLLKEPWIKNIVRLNKSFVVRRGLENMEMLRASKKLSEYIKDTIQNRNESVWIAQRAGRAKDGNDETNKGLITMFGMSAEGDVMEHFSKLNIVPVSVSYEYDPCDSRKTFQLYKELTDGNYVKSEKEDVESMQQGLINPKGKGHIHFGKVLNDTMANLPKEGKKSLLFSSITNAIDQQIQSNYKLWPSNYIANDMIEGTSSQNYSEAQKTEFTDRIQDILKSLDGDKNTMQEILLRMYQQPLLNYLKRQQ